MFVAERRVWCGLESQCGRWRVSGDSARRMKCFWEHPRRRFLLTSNRPGPTPKNMPIRSIPSSEKTTGRNRWPAFTPTRIFRVRSSKNSESSVTTSLQFRTGVATTRVCPTQEAVRGLHRRRRSGGGSEGNLRTTGSIRRVCGMRHYGGNRAGSDRERLETAR